MVKRPAALLAHQGQRMLVDLVEIRPLLAIDLDVDKELVHQLGDRRILEALMRHDMAPMAGGIADRQQDRLVRRLGGAKRRLAPGLPMHRIVLVLQQVGAGLLAEAVLVHGGSCRADLSGVPGGTVHCPRAATRLGFHSTPRTAVCVIRSAAPATAEKQQWPTHPPTRRSFIRAISSCAPMCGRKGIRAAVAWPAPRPPGGWTSCAAICARRRGGWGSRTFAPTPPAVSTAANSAPTWSIYPEGVWYRYESDRRHRRDRADASGRGRARRAADAAARPEAAGALIDPSALRGRA